MQQVLTRVNTYTGVAYRDDPTIMLWELANEPRATSDTSGATLEAWIDEMAAFIKGLDTNHLVATGEEGWYTDKGGDWRHDGTEGADFIRNSQSAFIDVASFHLYPFFYLMSEAEALDWINEHVQDAHEVIGKPVYLGEFGWRAPRELLGEFSAGVETWKVDWGFDAASPQRVESPSVDGDGAIQYQPDGALGPNQEAAGERWLPDPGFNFSEYDVVTGWVHLPPTAPPDLRADLFTKSGNNWTWRDGSDVPLTPGAWTQVALNVSDIDTPGQVRSVGIRVFGGSGAYSGPITYDLITAAATAAGQRLTDRDRVYGDWYARLDAQDTDGALVWMVAGHQPDTTWFPDWDEFTVYPAEDAETAAVLQDYADVVAQKNASGPIDQAPTAAIQQPASGATVSGTVTIRALATDDQGVPGATYAIDGGPAQGMVFVGSDTWEAAWDTTTLADGAHTITVEATDTIGQTATDQVSVTVNNAPPPGNVLFVQRIDLSLRAKGKNGIKKQAFGSVTILDGQGAPVSSATVQTRWSGLTNDVDVVTTGRNGVAKNIPSDQVNIVSGTFTLTVEDVSKNGVTYDPSLNVETSDSVSF